MKIPVLGLVVNRTGSDDDHGYYGYHRLRIRIRIRLRTTEYGRRRSRRREEDAAEGRRRVRCGRHRATTPTRKNRGRWSIPRRVA